MKKRTVLVLGATSDIGLVIAHSFANDGWDIQLAGRNLKQMEADQADLVIRYGISVRLSLFDVLDLTSVKTMIEELDPLPDVAVCVVGYMGDQKQSEDCVLHMSTVLRSNFEGPAAAIAMIARRFVDRNSGTIVGVSSVAGVRGRAANYTYGSAKSGFTEYLSGLRNRLCNSGSQVHVMAILPGFVRTRMTQDMDLPGILTAHPEEVASAVKRGLEKKKDVIFVRNLWRLISLIIRSIPESLFKRMSL